MRLAIVTTIIAGAVLTGAAQQPRPDRQPGRKWSEEQLRRESSHVRAGRSLNPKAWPNGARVAVALTFNVSNSANQLARGDTAAVIRHKTGAADRERSKARGCQVFCWQTH